MSDERITALHYADEVFVSWVEHPNETWRPYAVVQDDANSARMVFSVLPDGCIGASFAAPLHVPGRLVSYTYDINEHYARGEVRISDEGLLTALASPKGCEPGVELRIGFTVALPVHFVVPVRIAIERAFAEAEKRAVLGGQSA